MNPPEYIFTKEDLMRMTPNVARRAAEMLSQVVHTPEQVGDSDQVDGFWIETHTLGCRLYTTAGCTEDAWEQLYKIYDEEHTKEPNTILGGDPTDGAYVEVYPLKGSSVHEEINHIRKKEYNSGMCDVAALALHQLTGLPFGLVGGYWHDDEYEEDVFEAAHAVVMLTDGRWMDAYGIHSGIPNAHFNNNIDKVVIEPASENDVREAFTVCDINQEDIETAKNKISNQQWFKKYLNKNIKEEIDCIRKLSGLNIIDGVVKLQESTIPNITPNLVTKAIKHRLKKYLDNGTVPAACEIGSGWCDNFIDELWSEDLGLPSDYHDNKNVILSTNMFDKEDSYADLDLIRKHWGGVPEDIPEHELSMLIGGATHSWLYSNGKHYDAETPNGVDHFLKLPFFRRQIEGLRNELRGSIKEEIDGICKRSGISNSTIVVEGAIQGITLYHGTASNFGGKRMKRNKAPHPSDIGIWVTTSKDIASKFALRSKRVVHQTPMVYTVSANIANPLYLETYKDYIDLWMDRGRDSQKLRGYLMRKGYDGIVINSSTTDFGGEPRVDVTIFKPTDVTITDREEVATNEELNDIRRRAGLPIMEEKMVDVWHVTEKQNVPDILKNGLEPRIGKSSRSAGEKEPAIYVFPDELSMEDAITNWLGDETDYRQAALILRVPESWVTQDDIRWEATIKRPVPPKMIKVAIPDLDETT